MEKILIKEKNKTIESKNDLRNYEVSAISYNMAIEDFINTSRFEIHPYFQRNYVWNDRQKSNLMDTILTGMPIPAIYTYKDQETGKEIVIDGQQRLTTIRKFINNEFELKNLQNYTFLDDSNFFTLSKKWKDRINSFILTIVRIENVNNKNIIFDIFQKYNTGGVKLNPQEIRNCIYSGRYNDLIIELAKYQPFNNLFKDKKIDRMEKEEYVVRFLALYNNFDKYNGSINKLIDLHLEKQRSLEKLESEKFDEATKNSIKAFKKAVDASVEVFGLNAFKNCIEYKGAKSKLNIMYKTLSKPVFDMQMLGFTDFDLDLLIRHKGAIKNRYEELILNKEEMKPYYKNMSKKSVSYRISEWKKEISEIIRKP